MSKQEGGQLSSRLEEATGDVKRLEERVYDRLYDLAGFKADTPFGRAVRKTYDGPRDAEAIKVFAEQRYGIGTQPTTTDHHNEERGRDA